MKFWAVVPAAGIGARFGGTVPKQYALLNGTAIAAVTLQRLLAVDSELSIMVALHPADSWFAEAVPANPRISTCVGGRRRADSVLAALEAIEGEDDDWVLVHDVARPCVTVADIRKLLSELRNDPAGGLLAVAVSDTLKQVAEGIVTHTVDRDQVWAAVTPQMFRYGALRAALQNNDGVTDEASAMEKAGVCPRVVEGRRDNIKITCREDLAIAEAILRYQADEPKPAGAQA